MIQIHAETAASARRAPKDLFVIVRKNSGASTASLELSSIACHTRVRRNESALQGSV